MAHNRSPDDRPTRDTRLAPAPGGRFWPQDRDGHILNDAAKDKIDPAFAKAIRQGVDAARRNLPGRLHSVYVTGDVARGRAVPGQAQLDLHAVLKRDRDPGARALSWPAIAGGAATAGQSAARRIDITIHPWDDIFPATDTFSVPAFTLATMGVCVWGETILPRLAPVPLGPAVANGDIIRISATLREARARLGETIDLPSLRHLSARTALAILKAARSLVLLKEEEYTDDMDLAADLFTLHHPEYRRNLNAVRLLMDTMPDDAEPVARLIDRVQGWLVPLANRWLDLHNPDRREALELSLKSN